MGLVQQPLEANDDADSRLRISVEVIDIRLRISVEVIDILDAFFPQGLSSPTDTAIAAGRCRIIARDTANDDVAQAALAV